MFCIMGTSWGFLLYRFVCWTICDKDCAGVLFGEEGYV